MGKREMAKIKCDRIKVTYVLNKMVPFWSRYLKQFKRFPKLASEIQDG
jgi:hypothetical protein